MVRSLVRFWRQLWFILAVEVIPRKVRLGIMGNEVHYKDLKEWHVRYFTPKEIACKGTGKIVVDDYALRCLDMLRDVIGEPFSPNSAYRSAQHNKAVGGAKNSYHRKGMAFDIPIKGRMTREEIHRVAGMVGFRGVGDYDTFVHLDTGTERSWDKRS